MTPLPRPDPDVVYCDVEDGAVLLSTTGEVYYGLNRVGARIWTMLAPAHSSVEELCATLSREYPEVDPAVLRADLMDLLDDLAANGLVVLDSGS